ncbi:MAG: polysaccharide deacetylase family protein [Terriglobia bacterium]
MDWALAFVILLIAVWVVALIAYGCAAPSSQLLGRSLVRGPAGRCRVALTFDDGPTPPSTDRVLDVLKQYGVTATFFVNGKWAARFPETLRRVQREGHAIGNHTYSHLFVYLKSRRRMADEIDRTQAIIESITGQRPKLYRSPYGVRWFGLFSVLRRRGMISVQWSDTGYDWIKKNASSDIARKALAHVQDGSVILLHDGCGAKEAHEVDHLPTVAALPEIIESIRSRGYTFVQVQDFL